MVEEDIPGEQWYKTTEQQLSEMEIGNLLKKQLRVMIVKVI